MSSPQDTSESSAAQDALSLSSSARFSERFSCFGRSCSEWTLLVLSMMNVFIIIGISAKELHSSLSQRTCDPSFIFSIAVLFAAGFGSCFIIHGVLCQRAHSVYLHLASVFLAVSYSIVDYYFNVEHRDNFKIARMVIGVVLGMISIYIAMKVTTRNRWTEFTIIGASDGLLEMYKKLCYFLMLLKLDFEAGILLGIFSLTEALENKLHNILLLTGILVYSLAICIIGSIAVKKELKALVFLFIVLSFVLPVWVPFQVMYFECPLQNSCSHEDIVLAYTRLGAGTSGIVLRIYICIEVMKVYKNFGYGLTDHAFAGLVASESTNLLSRPRALNM
ncbi:uncharacterized protein LOC106463895 [Limulus polyphemus]|uniref:Uncharacterized protein LOC106463895 n=1 Tax=Limulus polyphemus TaxID=6850 RepID=A0ABM1BCV2_LIMPO|nr:uncharacterized protein LOC106463895 [Limulus polyphemus]